MDSAILTWTPQRGDHCNYHGPVFGFDTVTPVEITDITSGVSGDAPAYQISTLDGEQQAWAKLEELENTGDGYVKGEEAAAILQGIVEAPPVPEPPASIKKRVDTGIVAQMKDQAALVKDAKAQVALLRTRLEPILTHDGEKETTLTEPLEGKPAPLVGQLHDNNTDIANLCMSLRNIIAGVQL